MSLVAMTLGCTLSVILCNPHSQTEVRAICWGLKLGRNGSGGFGSSSNRRKQQLMWSWLVQLETHRPSRTMFMSMPLVYVQACWKYSSSLCLSGFGIWWKRMNSLTRSICRWYLAVPEYNLWMIADTFPKMLAYIRARREATEGNHEPRRPGLPRLCDTIRLIYADADLTICTDYTDGQISRRIGLTAN